MIVSICQAQVNASKNKTNTETATLSREMWNIGWKLRLGSFALFLTFLIFFPREQSEGDPTVTHYHKSGIIHLMEFSSLNLSLKLRMIFGQIHLMQFINHTVIITACFAFSSFSSVTLYYQPISLVRKCWGANWANRTNQHPRFHCSLLGRGSRIESRECFHSIKFVQTHM